MPVQPTLEAKVKDEYRMGPVIAFSGQEYVRSEWRPVPVGFESAAVVHPLLDTREMGGEEIHVASKDYLADANKESVSTETAVEEEETEKKPKRTRRSTPKDQE